MSFATGVTLFSLTGVWTADRPTLTALLESVAAHRLGPDLEVVGFQSFRSLPLPSPDEIARFRADCGRLGLRPVVYGVDVDRFARLGRRLSPAAQVASLAAQAEVAAALGCRVLRTMPGLAHAVLRGIEPVLDRLDLCLTFEIQGPARPGDEALVDLAEWIAGATPGRFGLTLDFSLAMPGLPEVYLAWLAEAGLTPTVQRVLDDEWRAPGPAFARYQTFAAAAALLGAPRLVVERAMPAFIRFGSGEASDWRELMSLVRHAHAKFWDTDLGDVASSHRAFLAELDRAAYAGSVVSEWGGHEWTALDADATIALLQQHVRLLRSEPALVPTS